MVVHNIRKVIGREAVRLNEHHIVQFRIFHGNIAVKLIMESRCALGRVILPNNIGKTESKLLLHFIL